MFITMLEKALGLDLGNCYKAVLTCEINEPLELEIHLWANKAVVNGVDELANMLIVRTIVDDE